MIIVQPVGSGQAPQQARVGPALFFHTRFALDNGEAATVPATGDDATYLYLTGAMNANAINLPSTMNATAISLDSAMNASDINLTGKAN